MTIIEIHQVIMKRQFNSENQQLCGRVCVALFYIFFVLSYYVSLRSEFRLLTIGVKQTMFA